MARAEIEQDIGGLPDHQLAGFQERRRERRRRSPASIIRAHRRHAACAARDVVVPGAGVLQREPDIFAAALDARPVIEFIAHDRPFSFAPTIGRR